MALYARLTCFPPLAQLSVIPLGTQEIAFILVLESWNEFHPDWPWEASLCYKSAASSHSLKNWSIIELNEDDSNLPTFVNEGSESYGYFQTSFVGNLLPSKTISDGLTIEDISPLLFTIRYREDSSSPWLWADSQLGIPYGEIIIQRTLDTTATSQSLTSLQIEPGWKSKQLSVDYPGATTFFIASNDPIPQVDICESTFLQKSLGNVKNQVRFMALTRFKEPWLGPRHGKDLFHISEDAVMSTFMNAAGHHITILPVSGVDNVVTVLRSGTSDEIVIAARNDGTTDSPFRLVVAHALSVKASIAAAVAGARLVVSEISGSERLIKEVSRLIETNDQPEDNQIKDWHDGLGYCSYNSLGLDISLHKILSGLESLASHGIHVSNLIIDDNWQTVEKPETHISLFHGTWKEFEANGDCFPHGLKAAVSQIRLKYPQIKDVAVWHALLGYWGGICPTGSLAKSYKTTELTAQLTDHETKTILAIHPDDIHQLYDDFYSFLSSCGISAVKTDAQFMLDQLEATSLRAAFSSKYQAAWTNAHVKHFKGRAISCMSMIPQILFGSLSLQTLPRISLRTSDDYFPDIPPSHPLHLFINAHNALLTKHLNVLPDWDMFQTKHPYAGFHAAARCLSGGPIYITDVPGQHNVDLIEQITAINLHGRRVTLRPTGLGETISVYDHFAEGKLLKIGASTGDFPSPSAAGLLGLFNIADKETTYCLPVTEIPVVVQAINSLRNETLALGTKLIVRSHQEDRVFFPIYLDSPIVPSGLLHGTLPVRGFDVLSAHPVYLCCVKGWYKNDHHEICILGLLRKMTGAAAVVSCDFKPLHDERQLLVTIELKALGTLGIWIGSLQRDMPIQVTLQGWSVPNSMIDMLNEFDYEYTDNRILRIDLESCWNDMPKDLFDKDTVKVRVLLGLDPTADPEIPPPTPIRCFPRIE